MAVVKFRKSRRGRERKLGKLLRILGIFIAFVLIFELVWLFITSFPQKTVVADHGSIAKGCWVETVFLRNEYPIITPVDGFLKTRVKTGAMIPYGELIGWISRERLEQMPDEALRLSSKLAGLQNETIGLQLELKRLNHEIYYRGYKFKSRSAAKAIENQHDLRLQEQDRQRVLQNIRSNRSEIAELHTSLRNLTDGSTLISNRNSGIFSTETDGFENELKPAKFRELTKDIFKKNYRLRSPGKRVHKGQVIGKIIQPFSEMLVVKVNPAQVGNPRIGDQWEVKYGNEYRKIEIIDIISLSKDKMMIGLLSRNPEATYTPERRRQLFIIYRRTKGISIPVQAIFKKNHRTMVKLVKGDEFLEQEIQVLETDGNQAIVSGLEFGTAILSR